MQKKFVTRIGIGLAIVAMAFAYITAAGKMEQSRSATPLEGGTAVSGPPVDTPSLMADVGTLASPMFKGRLTGTEGSKLAQAYISKRFSEIGLAHYGAGYAMPFAFTRKSIRGLLSPDKKYTTEYPDATNLVGYIRGSKDPNRIMVVSAHYDHLGERAGAVYHGADDNASGVGAMLAVAAYFKQHPPLHTVVFAAFDAEELGSGGANHFIEALPFPRAQLAFNLNLDMVSRNDSNEVWASGLYHNPSLKYLAAAAAKHSTVKVRTGHDKPMLLAGLVEDWTSSSDHRSFHAAGVPFLYFGVADHADYHQPTDVAEKIDPVFYSKVTSLLIDVALMADHNLQAIR